MRHIDANRNQQGSIQSQSGCRLLESLYDQFYDIFDRLTVLCGVGELPPQSEQATEREQPSAPIIIDRRKQMMELFGIKESDYQAVGINSVRAGSSRCPPLLVAVSRQWLKIRLFGVFC